MTTKKYRTGMRSKLKPGVSDGSCAFCGIQNEQGVTCSGCMGRRSRSKASNFWVGTQGEGILEGHPSHPNLFSFSARKTHLQWGFLLLFRGRRQQQPVQKCVMEYPIRIRKGGRYGALSNPRMGIYLATVGRSRRFAKPSVPLRAFYRTVPEFFSP